MKIPIVGYFICKKRGIFLTITFGGKSSSFACSSMQKNNPGVLPGLFDFYGV